MKLTEKQKNCPYCQTHIVDINYLPKCGRDLRSEKKMNKSDVESIYRDLVDSLCDMPDDPIEALENSKAVAQGALVLIKQILEYGFEEDN